MIVGVIADDYTGAADTGVQFAKKGLKTSIVKDIKSIIKIVERVDVLVFDTESRVDPREVAYKKVAAVSREFEKAGIGFIYKKIDSTLRGNIGAELDALLDTRNTSIVVFCPAYPKNDRITVGGYHLVNQILLDQTEMAKDPEFLVKESFLPSLIHSQTTKHVSLIEILSVTKGIKTLKKEIESHARRGSRILVVDAVSQKNLKILARVISSLDQPVIVCGSGGLAEELPEALGLVHRRSEQIIVISGTLRSVTAQQIRDAETALNIQIINIKMRRVLIGKTEKISEVCRVVTEVKRAFDAQRDVVVRWAESRDSARNILEFGKSLGLNDEEMRKRIGQVLGEIAHSILSCLQIEGIVLTGGETAFNVYQALGVLEVQVLVEVLPGIPIVKLIGGTADGIRAITKAGAFGDRKTLTMIIEYLRSHHEQGV